MSQLCRDFNCCWGFDGDEIEKYITWDWSASLKSGLVFVKNQLSFLTDFYISSPVRRRRSLTESLSAAHEFRSIDKNPDVYTRISFVITILSDQFCDCPISNIKEFILHFSVTKEVIIIIVK